MEHRQVFLSQPPEFYSAFFHGRIPTMMEKLHFVETRVQQLLSTHFYRNNIYQIDVSDRHPFTLLSIHRHDGRPCRNWAHFQYIKDTILGPEWEAVELYPAESRRVDARHEYHLWAYPRLRGLLGLM